MGLNRIGLFALTGALGGLLSIAGRAQTVSSAAGGGLPLSIGLGVSDYDVDWGHGRMVGGTVWIDYDLDRGPAYLRGLGVEVEARDINLNRSSTQPSNFRLETLGGGPIYFAELRRIPNLRPYGKFNIYYAGIDWNNPDPRYTHETRAATAPGLGFEYRVYRSILFRADYEYQFWPDIVVPGRVLNPQGFTLGGMYDFSHDHGR